MYSLRTEKKSLKKPILILVVVLFLFIADKFLFGSFIKKTGLDLFGGPLEGLSQKITDRSATFKALLDFKFLAEENKKLKEENLNLIAEVSELKSLERENEFFRSQLGLNLRERGELISANMISVDKTPPYSAIIINKGQKDGIERKMAVISSSSILAGVIDEVYENYSVALLLDDSRLSISVRQENTDILSSTKGISGGEFILDLVAADEEISSDEIVVTSGMDSLPEGLPVGKVLSTDKKSGDAFQTVKVESFFNPSSGPNLFIIKK
ncbi:MAG: rod shape-determining protein MreC [Candidatus Yanofskybacteria bacterium CG10_big_fil_rev_8_21_14_0_10_36_16]|uniref:Cell shape-determining protein MreC n=1 Tax=Candidatus Yanofskybacteria bacterium CG10_big_fil_rev_8_21_14_0_10_36_16 TaxID=1975096 RepID=A0A2J0Q6V7_9BACT|nr:MAG: rod shape-determining protein MreC [Candidatus Yanofskybacteria bacterium CG10_big_fil_rev_8_21_14_0_10_36_16]